MSTPVISRRSNKAGDDSLLQQSDSSRLTSSSSNLLLTATIPNIQAQVSSISEPSSKSYRGIHSMWKNWRRRIPCLKKLQDLFLKVPPRVRFCFFLVWICWKVVVALAFLVVLISTGQNQSPENIHGTAISASTVGFRPPTRVLYIVTTLAEYNSGTRATIRGQDRLNEIMLPVLVDNIESMIRPPYYYKVDVYLICGYAIRPEREQVIRDRLPPGVGLQVWNSAPPLGYDNRQSKDKLIENTRALARQHRYVIKDKFPYYDLFAAFEDDMRITGAHVDHFLTVSLEIDKLREMAPKQRDNDVPDNVDNYNATKFFGQMTKQQLSRMIPGFIRVEVLRNETRALPMGEIAPVERDYEFEEVGTKHIDPEICCRVHVPQEAAIPQHVPEPSDLVMWETNIQAFSVRKLPPGSTILDWVVLMMGPGKRLDPKEKIGGYWSGREGAFGDMPRPSGGDPKLIAQQGGWMATREQLTQMNEGLCMGGFLPPFDEPNFSGDGQHSMNVEFWSGSYQIFTGVRGGCNMQRIIGLQPDHLSKSMIYHVANNKQLQLGPSRMIRADTVFGQLNRVRKMASKAMGVATSSP